MYRVGNKNQNVIYNFWYVPKICESLFKFICNFSVLTF